jgi:hypothetical protein
VLIALLAVVGVDLVVVVFLLAGVCTRKRWVRRRSGVFHGAIRVAAGELDGLGGRWRRGYGYWVRDVLVWTKAPFLFRNRLVPIDSLVVARPAGPGEVRRLGNAPIVAELASGGATVEVAARPEQRTRLLGGLAAQSSEPATVP